MYPVFFQWGDLIVPTWHVIFVLAVVSGFFYFLWLHKKYPGDLSSQQCSWFFMMGYLGGLLGARLYSLFFDEGLRSFSLSQVFSIGPLSFYGSLMGGSLFSFTYLYFQKVCFKDVGDKLILAILWGLTLGRLGCFFNGDDYGRLVPILSLIHI